MGKSDKTYMLLNLHILHQQRYKASSIGTAAQEKKKKRYLPDTPQLSGIFFSEYKGDW